MDTLETANEEAYTAFCSAQEELDDLTTGLVSALSGDRVPQLAASVRAAEIVAGIFLLGHRKGACQ